jgi:tRNA threonylcarbamoyladenosine biosynthesis protein TsaE
MKKIITKNEKETFDCGFEFAKKLKGGEVLALNGNLGAGKTKFLQGLAKGLGVKERVNNPTFNILKLYKTFRLGKIKIFCHIDAYRLNNEKDLISLGIEEFFSQFEVVTAVEWADKVKKIWPKKTTKIKIKSLSENSREIIIK